MCTAWTGLSFAVFGGVLEMARSMLMKGGEGRKSRNQGRKGIMEQESLSPMDSGTEPAVPIGASIISSLPEARLATVYDPIPAVLQPLCLLPVQYSDLLRRSTVNEGESRLLLAVLKDALRSYIKNMDGQTTQARREFDEDCEWFYGENQRGIFAFEDLCDALGIHPEPLRRWLRSLHDSAGNAELPDSSRL
jgi:hypothetical protein